MKKSQPTRETRNQSNVAQMTSIPSCPILRPTNDEFKDFFSFVTKAEKKYQKDYGMVKVVAPSGWKPHSGYAEDFIHNLPVKNPIQQYAQGEHGFYQAYLETKKSMTLKEYMESVYVHDQSTDEISAEKIEAKFWSTVNFEPPLYGADIQNSLMKEMAGGWNLNNLDSLVKVAFGEDKCTGVNSCYLYIGSWKSFFSWHKEDLDLSAINFLHEGNTKFWYSIPSYQSELLESAARKHYPQLYAKCPEFLRHKTTLINPYTLKTKCPQLKISKVQHNPNEFMLIFGGAYHMGFNFGFNIAEAINYATLQWLETVPDSKYCNCKKSSVKIDLLNLRNNLLQCNLSFIKSDPLSKSKEFKKFTKKLENIYGPKIFETNFAQKMDEEDIIKQKSCSETVVSYDYFIEQAEQLSEQCRNCAQKILEE